MSETVDVLLYGLGAIGSFYAFILSQNPRVRLSVCARSNYEAVKEKGVTIRSENHGGEFNFRPVKVLRSPEEAQHTYDYVVCVHKAVNTDAVLKQLAPVVNDNTVSSRADWCWSERSRVAAARAPVVPVNDPHLTLVHLY